MKTNLTFVCVEHEIGVDSMAEWRPFTRKNTQIGAGEAIVERDNLPEKKFKKMTYQIERYANGVFVNSYDYNPRNLFGPA